MLQIKHVKPNTAELVADFLAYLPKQIYQPDLTSCSLKRKRKSWAL